MSDIDPKILARMRKEESFLQSQSRGARRVKIPKGQSWLLRFMPAELGNEGMWYARIARHWLNKVPIVCPRLTGEDFGGSIDTDCPVCRLADELNGDSDEDISRFGYKSQANPQYMTYCVVFEKDEQQQANAEIMNPYEFLLYKGTFEELMGFYKAGLRRTDLSIFDWKKGNDFMASNGTKGIRLDKMDSAPIFDTQDPNFAAHVEKLKKAMKNPKIVMPTEDQLDAFADKLQDAALRLDHRGGGGGRGRGGRRFEDEEDEPRGRGRSNRRDDPEEEVDRPARSSRSREVEEDDVPYDDPPRKARRHVEEEEPERPARSSRRPEPEEQDEPERPARRRAPVEEQEPERPVRGRRDDPEPEEEPERPTRRRVAAEEEPGPRRSRAAAAAEPEDEPEPEEPAAEDEPKAAEADPPEQEVEQPSRGKLAPTENSKRARQEAASSPGRTSTHEEEDPEDPLPEDDKDPVPASKSLPEKGKNGEGEEPPPVRQRGAMGSQIKERLRNIQKSGA